MLVTISYCLLARPVHHLRTDEECLWKNFLLFQVPSLIMEARTQYRFALFLSAFGVLCVRLFLFIVFYLSQTAGSFNNSNNSHRPSLTSTENLIEPITSSTVGQSRYQPPNWIRHQQQPPLSFSNPAYQQRHQAELIQRGVSSPASLSMSALDHQTDPTVPKLTKFSPATGTDHSMSFENFDNQGSQELTGPVSSSTTVLMNQTHQPLSSAFRGKLFDYQKSQSI